MNGMAQSASPLSVSSLAQLTLSLLLIVALIFAISWVLKRFKLAGPRGRGDITVLDQLTIGPRERVLLIGIGERQVLIGVSAAGMVGLTLLEKSIELKSVPGEPLFAERLREYIKRPGGAT